MVPKCVPAHGLLREYQILIRTRILIQLQNLFIEKDIDPFFGFTPTWNVTTISFAECLLCLWTLGCPLKGIRTAGFSSAGLTVKSVGNVLPVTRWLILSSAYKSWQSMMVSNRAVDQLHSWDSWVSTVKLINCYMGYHHGLSGLICRALSQPPSYKETFSFRFYWCPGMREEDSTRNWYQYHIYYWLTATDFYMYMFSV